MLGIHPDALTDANKEQIIAARDAIAALADNQIKPYIDGINGEVIYIWGDDMPVTTPEEELQFPLVNYEGESIYDNPDFQPFIIPYLLWFVAVAGILVYTLLFDIKSFRRFMWFIILTYSAAILIYLLFPTCQQLRPEAFARDNVFTCFLGWFYTFDTNTNVCPSIHVLGAVAVLATAWHARGLSTPAWRGALTVLTVLICLSTVFLKQHSALDVAAALPLCAIAYRLVFLRPAEPVGQRAGKGKKRVENSTW